MKTVVYILIASYNSQHCGIGRRNHLCTKRPKNLFEPGTTPSGDSPPLTVVDPKLVSHVKLILQTASMTYKNYRSILKKHLEDETLKDIGV